MNYDASQQVEKTSLSHEIEVSHEIVAEIRAILFGGDENSPLKAGIGIVENLKDRVQELNVKLEDILKSVRQLK